MTKFISYFIEPVYLTRLCYGNVNFYLQFLSKRNDNIEEKCSSPNNILIASN
jgi:hypothetical protein